MSSSTFQLDLDLASLLGYVPFTPDGKWYKSEPSFGIWLIESHPISWSPTRNHKDFVEVLEFLKEKNLLGKFSDMVWTRFVNDDDFIFTESMAYIFFLPLEQLCVFAKQVLEENLNG